MNKFSSKFFYAGVFGISLFEILNVYFIMPMPGSQDLKSIDLAYFLYRQRWIFRIAFIIIIASGTVNAFKIKHKWLPSICLIIAAFIIYSFNFQMTADKMFRQPEALIFKSSEKNNVDNNSIVIAVEHNGSVKAYPVQFMSYHHQVQDTVGGKPLMITYCNVCRSGRVFEPIVNGQHETFRLVGMDHFNAMFEDAATKSWWRQVTGEAVAGKLKGQRLHETESMQLSIKKLYEIYPNAVVMQADNTAKIKYDTLRKFEQGLSKSILTRTDSVPWKEKSWVLGIAVGSESKAYNWKLLESQRLINDKVGGKPIVIALADDGLSFAAFERPNESELFRISNDTLFSDAAKFDLTGRSQDSNIQPLKRIKAYQEFWHSWKTFHPKTLKSD